MPPSAVTETEANSGYNCGVVAVPVVAILMVITIPVVPIAIQATVQFITEELEVDSEQQVNLATATPAATAMHSAVLPRRNLQRLRQGLLRRLR